MRRVIKTGLQGQDVCLIQESLFQNEQNLMKMFQEGISLR